MNEQLADPARQSLGRPLTEDEQALADALFAIFLAGTHDFGGVATALQEKGVPRPSGAPAPWSVPALEEELRRINLSLDAAYEAGLAGRLP